MSEHCGEWEEPAAPITLSGECSLGHYPPVCEILYQKRSLTQDSLLLETARKHISCYAMLSFKVIHYVEIDTITPHVCHGSLITLE